MLDARGDISANGAADELGVGNGAEKGAELFRGGELELGVRLTVNAVDNGLGGGPGLAFFFFVRGAFGIATVEGVGEKADQTILGQIVRDRAFQALRVHGRDAYAGRGTTGDHEGAMWHGRGSKTW